MADETLTGLHRDRVADIGLVFKQQVVIRQVQAKTNYGIVYWRDAKPEDLSTRDTNEESEADNG